MGQAYIMRRGSGGIKIRVSAYASAEQLPEVAQKNTIAVISEIPVSYAYVQATRPENPTEGAVWIKSKGGEDITLRSPSAGVDIGIEFVRQYNGTEWVNVAAYAHNGTEWYAVSVARLYLYDRGTDVTEATGGWEKDENGGMTLTFGTDSAVLKITRDADRYATAYTKNKIDVSQFSSLYMVVTSAKGRENKGSLYLGLTENVYTGGTGSELLNSFKAGTERNVAPDKNNTITAETEIVVDISNVQGEYMVQFGASIADATVVEIYMV